MDRGRRTATAALSALLVLAAVACASRAASTSAAVPAVAAEGAATVILDGLAFTPADLTVERGTVVTWKWADGSKHNVVWDVFRSETKREGTFSHRFDQPGTFAYLCNLLPKMTGTVTVTP